MKIELLQDLKNTSMYSKELPHEYKRGAVLMVEYASNLPKESGIVFWIVQDGWQDDPYGFPIYNDVDYVFTV